MQKGGYLAVIFRENIFVFLFGTFNKLSWNGFYVVHISSEKYFKRLYQNYFHELLNTGDTISVFIRLQKIHLCYHRINNAMQKQKQRFYLTLDIT